MPAHLQEPLPAQGVSSLSGSIQAALLRGAILLTATPRAARDCLRRFDAQRQQEGSVSAWQAPVILPWNAWVNSLWRDAVVCGIESRVLLNTIQERALWTGAITGASQPVVSPASTHVRMCMSALRLLGAYDVHSRFHEQQGIGPNAETFATWFSRFEELCSEGGYLPAAFAEIELARHLVQRTLKPVGEYILYGFLSMTPAQKHLQSALRRAGARVEQIYPAVRQSESPRIIRCTSMREEAGACADWARRLLAENPEVRLSIIVPDLDAGHAELERELRSTIAPEHSDVTRGAHQPRYEFSSGRPLNRLPMIGDALRLLRWCAGDLPVEEAGMLLRSPRVALAPTPERGAELDAFVLLKANVLRAELSLRFAAAALRSHDAPTAKRLTALAWAARSIQRDTHTFAGLADTARDLLRVAGWPGPNELNSEEYQAVDRWNDALDRLATLDLFGRKPTFDEALSQLEHIAAEMRFAPENTASPVQIISLSEAAGVTAGALWFLHADENTLNTRRSPHPLLPLHLQRDCHMPGTDLANDERALAGILQHFAAGSGQAVFSYASTAGETPQRLAPVLSRLAEEWHAQHVHQQPGPEQPEATPFLEIAEDNTLLPALPPGTVSGGVSVIAGQAQCAFRAFAEHRLFASAPEQVEAGFSPRERGDHLHHVLKAFWSEVKDHAGLIEITRRKSPDGPSERDLLLKRLVADLYKPSHEGPWHDSYLAVQRQRLVTLLCAWLDVEAARQPFTVAATEHEVEAAILGPLTLRLRVDRIDTVRSGGRESALLIDYKTGSAEPRDWFGERPDQPQLPVYAVAAGIKQVNGIAFGVVRLRDKDRRLKTFGESSKPLRIRGVETSFESQRTAWQRNLEHLAVAFAKGDASVDPKEYPKTCEHCEQRMLCRVEACKPLELDDPEEEFEVPEWP